MKANLLSVVMVLCLLLPLASSQFCKASGEGLNDDQMLINLEQIYFTDEIIQAGTLYNVSFLSDEEIWFHFLTEKSHGIFLRADLYGNIIEKLDIRLNGKDPSILCINHVEDRLVIGYKDDKTTEQKLSSWINKEKKLQGKI